MSVLRGRPDAVVFDLDGTLADTAGNIARALNAALAAAGLQTIPVDAVRLMIGKGPAVLVERALRYQGVDPHGGLREQLTTAYLREHAALGNDTSSLYPGAADCLAGLAASGIAAGVCSNKPQAFCVALLGQLGVAGRCGAIRGSATDLPSKPDPAMLFAVIAALGADPQRVLYVGDSATDVQLARAAGVPVILVDYGYTATPAAELGADGVIGSLADLPRAWGDTNAPLHGDD